MNSDYRQERPKWIRFRWSRALLPLVLLGMPVGVVLPSAAPSQTALVYRQDSLVDVVRPDHKLVLAKETEIRLILHARGLTQVSTGQGHVAENGQVSSDVIRGSGQVVPVLYHPDGSAFIKVTPMRLGKVTLEVNGRFPDGGLFLKQCVLDVEPPERQPLELRVGEAAIPEGSSPRRLLYLAGKDWDALVINARYEGIKDLIRIDPAFVEFTVRTNAAVPIVHLDKSTGVITPLNIGVALVLTKFGDKKVLTCAIVIQKISDWYDHQGCEKLLASGEELPSFR